MEFAGSSSSLSKSKPSQWLYDVFINFRGSDTRKKFISHLYHALSKNAGVNTFLDEENLQKGMELQALLRAIEYSQIAIVVFSKSYTESTWCLTELEKIIECHETYGQSLVPIFYDIDPSDVRHQKGDFGETLKAVAARKYSGVHLEQALSRWSRALTKAANLAGWDVREVRNEADLVKEIVNVVLNILDYEVLSITEFPVGLVSRVQEVIRFIENHQSTKVCIIGIWGMGGLGKTTTAKVIYNLIHRRFMSKSFIESIREFCETERRGLVRLQEQLLLDVLKTKEEILSVGMGTTKIENRLAGKRALIVLDDVNEFGQLKALSGERKRMGQGSVIIITTRNLRLLDQFEVDYVYEMDKMDESESLKLFSWHAFGEAKPREDFNELARNAVAYCGGLPLALEVLGSDLKERTPDVWRSVLSKREIIPNAQVQKILKISYDGCDEIDQKIFLDVCCVFIGKDRADVIEILNGCGLRANSGILVLTEHGLIKVDKNNKIGMHRLLRDMGREIIRKRSTDRLGNRSHLWFQEDVLDVLTNNIGTEAVEGLALKLHLTNTDCFKTNAFEEMKSLRLLQLAHVDLTGDYGYLPKQLRWIYWQGFPLKYVPNNLCLEGVIAVDFKHSSLNQVWQEAKVLQCLKILNLSHSKCLTETPDFSKLPSLEKLILKHCPSLWKIHQTIGDLRNLLLINLKGCTNLSNLPRETYKLKSLKTLILSGCSKIDKLEDILQMESLTTLITENIVVEQVPFSIVWSKRIGYICLHRHKGLSLDVFHSIIWSWMSPTINPLSCIRPFCGKSPSLVSMNMKIKHLGDLGPILSSLLNLRSVLVQCDQEFQKSNPISTIMDEVYPVNLTELETTPYTSEISKHSLEYDLIGIGSYKEEVFNTLRKSISKGLTTTESCNVLFPGDRHPYWFAHMGGKGQSVCFTVPRDCHLKGMIICVVYLSTSETRATECLLSVSMVNYTKCTVQIYKRDTVISFNEVDWQGITSHMGSGDQVEIFVTFRNGLVVKKTVVYLMCDESSDMEIELVSRPPIKKVYSRKRKRMATKY